jgi:hypothetical protein
VSVATSVVVVSGSTFEEVSTALLSTGVEIVVSSAIGLLSP